MDFEWDESKNAANIAKHTLSFYEAQDAFFDKHRVILHDTKHSAAEKDISVLANWITAELPPSGSP